jgi:hypothetical protein
MQMHMALFILFIWFWQVNSGCSLISLIYIKPPPEIDGALSGINKALCRRWSPSCLTLILVKVAH